MSLGPFEGPIKHLQVAAAVYPNAVRGNVWDDRLSLGAPNPDPPLCPGTYRLEVAVTNRGIFDPHRFKLYFGGPYPGKPFGATAFIVRPAPSSHTLTPILVAVAVAAVALATIMRRRRAAMT